jgi:hypothetical protein
MPDEEGRIPELREALERTEEELPPEFRRKPTLPEKIPPPPRDWVSHPVTRIIGAILVLIGLYFVWRKWPDWRQDLKANASGASLVLFAIIMGIAIMVIAWWRGRDIAAGAIWRTPYDTSGKRPVSRRPKS